MSNSTDKITHLVRDAVAKLPQPSGNGLGETVTEEEKNALCVCFWAFESYIGNQLDRYGLLIQDIPKSAAEYNNMPGPADRVPYEDLPDFTAEQREQALALREDAMYQVTEMRERLWLLGNGGPRSEVMSDGSPASMVSCENVNASLAWARTNLEKALEGCLSIEKVLLESRSPLIKYINIGDERSPASHIHLTSMLYYSEAMRQVFFSLSLYRRTEVMLGPDVSEIFPSTELKPIPEDVMCQICGDNGDCPEYETWTTDYLAIEGIPHQHQHRDFQDGDDIKGNTQKTLMATLCCSAFYHPTCLLDAIRKAGCTYQCLHCQKGLGWAGVGHLFEQHKTRLRHKARKMHDTMMQDTRSVCLTVGHQEMTD